MTERDTREERGCGMSCAFNIWISFCGQEQMELRQHAGYPRGRLRWYSLSAVMSVCEWLVGAQKAEWAASTASSAIYRHYIALFNNMHSIDDCIMAAYGICLHPNSSNYTIEVALVIQFGVDLRCCVRRCFDTGICPFTWNSNARQAIS